MSTCSSAAAKSMVVVVDVVDAATTNADNDAAGAHARASGKARGIDFPIERLMIDVDVTPHTTADDLLADVEAALEEMSCALCVPRGAGALAEGQVLPPLAALVLAMRLTRSNENGAAAIASSGSGSSDLAATYASAVRHVRGGAALAKGTLCIGNERVLRPLSASAASLPQQEELQTLWSVVPRSLGEPAQPFAGVSAATATAAAASTRMLPRDEPAASPKAAITAAERGGDASEGAGEATKEAARGSAARRSACDTPLATASPSADAATKPLPYGAAHSGDNKVFKSSGVSGQASGASHSAVREPGSAVVPAVPSLSPPPAAAFASHTPTSVVALEDVDVFSFRRLQAHRALVLSRVEAASSTLVLPGGVGAATSEEQQRLQPTLPWAAVEGAIQMEVLRLQSEKVLMGACVITDNGLNKASGMSHRPPPSVGATRARLRAAWLKAVQEETAAYQTGAQELRRDTEKAEVWRAALKANLRSEIAELEEEVAHLKTVLAERDVLHVRSTQLEAQVAAAKAEEMALLQSSKALPERVEAAATTAPTAAERSATSANEKEGATAQPGDVNTWKQALETSAESSPQRQNGVAHRQLRSPSSPSSSSAHSEASSGSDPPLPPPSSAAYSALSSTPQPKADSVTTISSHAEMRTQRLRDPRWSGRRVPLVHPGTAAPPPPQSLSPLSIERSGLSPSLLAEVRAALAYDVEEGTDSTPSDNAEISGRSDIRSVQSNRQILKGTTVGATPDGFPLPVALPLSSRRRRYQRKEAAAAWGEDDIPAGLSDAVASAVHPRQAPSAPIPSPVFFSLHDNEERASLSTSHCSQPSDRRAAVQSPSRNAANSSVVEELRRVTSALHQHIRGLHPDPLEGQRLLQQVRGLRFEVERGDANGERGDREENAQAAEARSSRRGREGDASFTHPREAPTSASASRLSGRQSSASQFLLCDSHVPSRRAGPYGY
ncbi:hypothetical protein ABL78_1801 [Leptomonas seymouri]|uniref:Uncharacterized protein n=1 Tax=Leptomonas seymouri TaxID=5684 RepID=A0A0N1I049_LEPSE|nr:hypothetical protein ABL78_1801 [Leptomonas seymouri]|eukprot:KPI89065.1 hypothetical protein ABL78_1801 [Leptomonas seymouri]